MKKNNWIWIAGGAILVWYFMRSKKKPNLFRMSIPYGGPRRQKVAQQTEQIAQNLSFEPDTTTDKQMYVDSQKYCK